MADTIYNIIRKREKEEKVKVVFDDTKLKESEIINAIENEGYTVA